MGLRVIEGMIATLSPNKLKPNTKQTKEQAKAPQAFNPKPRTLQTLQDLKAEGQLFKP